MDVIFPKLSYNFHSNVLILVSYFPIIGMILTFILARRSKGSKKTFTLFFFPVVIIGIGYLAWGASTPHVPYQEVLFQFYFMYGALAIFLGIYYIILLIGNIIKRIKRLIKETKN